MGAVKRIVIVAGAPWRWEPRFVTLVSAADEVLAADGGANHLARIGVRPAAVVGDLDSIRASVRRWVGEERIVHRPDQETTDLDKTLACAFDERSAGAVTVLAATGGRLDHALANLGLLGRYLGRGAVELRDELARIVPVAGEASFATRPGQAVSLVSPGGCERVWTEGLRWPLAGGRLGPASPHGVSNRAEGDRVAVRVAGGTLLVFLFDPA